MLVIKGGVSDFLAMDLKELPDLYCAVRELGKITDQVHVVQSHAHERPGVFITCPRLTAVAEVYELTADNAHVMQEHLIRARSAGALGKAIAQQMWWGAPTPISDGSVAMAFTLQGMRKSDIETMSGVILGGGVGDIDYTQSINYMLVTRTEEGVYLDLMEDMDTSKYNHHITVQYSGGVYKLKHIK